MVEQFEEVPGSRTVQPTQVQPGKADEIAYRDLQPGEVIRAGDEGRSISGRWALFHQSMIGQPVQGSGHRRPYNITELLKQRDQVAHEYRLYREALTAEQAAHKITMANGLQACKERDEAEKQRQHLQTALEELQRRQDAVAGVDTLTVGEVVENILSALEIAGHALEYLADGGANEEASYSYCGFNAAIAVVRKIREAAK